MLFQLLPVHIRQGQWCLSASFWSHRCSNWANTGEAVYPVVKQTIAVAISARTQEKSHMTCWCHTHLKFTKTSFTSSQRDCMSTEPTWGKASWESLLGTLLRSTHCSGVQHDGYQQPTQGSHKLQVHTAISLISALTVATYSENMH